MTKAHIRRGARPGEDWAQARARLDAEAGARHAAAIDKLNNEYYDLMDHLFRMVYGMGPKYPPAERQIRERLAFIKRRAWKRYQLDFSPPWC